MSITNSKTLRIMATSAGLLLVVALILMLARNVADDAYSVGGLTTSILGAFTVIVLLGSLYEWIVHRQRLTAAVGGVHGQRGSRSMGTRVLP